MQKTSAILLLLAITIPVPFTCSAAARDASTDVAFLDAVAHRDIATVRQMLSTDPSLANAKRPNGRTAVTVAMFAIRKGEETFPDPASNDVLQEILAHNPQLDLFDTAAVGRAERLATMLHDDPSALNSKTQYGWTLLHLASYGGNTATAELLIKSGADVNARAATKFRNTPLQAALLSGQYATARLLIDHGADVLARQAHGFTAMHEAAQLGRADLVQLLLDHGAEINSVADDGLTPLGAAIRAHRDEIAKLLQSKGATVEPVADEESLAKPARGYVVIEGEVTDGEAIKPYAARVEDTLAPFHYEFLTRAGRTASLEGEPPRNVIVIAFDSVDQAKAWYDSAAYTAIKPIRQRAAKSRIFIVEGVGGGK